ncbi:MAG: hypothetical protein LBN97_03160 [Oscillospiraceae bacterium]|jgi:hypothetical protein|nr:hypothetical protein [Oscillospiraceae bacterium]
MKKPYNADRTVRDYVPEVLLAPKPRGNGAILTAMIILLLLMITSLVVKHTLYKPMSLVFTLAVLAVCVAATVYCAKRALQRLTLQRKFLLNGAYMQSEKSSKRIYRGRIVVIAVLVIEFAFLALVIWLGISDGFTKFTDLDMAFSLSVFYLNTNNLLLNPVTGLSGVVPLIFCDDRFYSGGFEVAYAGLSVTSRTKISGSPVKTVSAVFCKDGEEAGHDLLKIEDFRYLESILGAFEQYAGGVK